MQRTTDHVQPTGYIYSTTPPPKAQGTVWKSGKNVKAWGPEVCCEIVPSRHGRKTTPMKSQQYSCLNKTRKKKNDALWHPSMNGEIHEDPHQIKRHRQWMVPERGKSVFSRDNVCDRLSHPKRSIPNTYIHMINTKWIQQVVSINLNVYM